jgi:hypothetical protein
VLISPSGHLDLAGVDEAREVVRETTSAIVIIRGRSKRDLEIHQHSAAVRRLARG